MRRSFSPGVSNAVSAMRPAPPIWPQVLNLRGQGAELVSLNPWSKVIRSAQKPSSISINVSPVLTVKVAAPVGLNIAESSISAARG